MKNSQNLLQ